MQVHFITSDVSTARGYIKNGKWQAVKDNEEKVLQAVEDGLVRIGDPFMYGDVKIATGDKWKGSNIEFTDFIYDLLRGGVREDEQEAKPLSNNQKRTT